jgi:hypothetical protein
VSLNLMRWRTAALLVGLLAVLGAVMVYPSSSSPPPDNLHAAVLDARYHETDGYVGVIIQAHDTEAARAAVEAAGGVVARQFSIARPSKRGSRPARSRRSPGTMPSARSASTPT